MSIVINGFDKPDNCLSCPFNHASCYCNITKVEIDRDDYTSSACPITQLPKGHGRLKDVDWIDDNCDGHYSDKDGSWCYAWKDIDNAPTIVEAESEVEK